jgi:hypothetical protein
LTLCLADRIASNITGKNWTPLLNSSAVPPETNRLLTVLPIARTNSSDPTGGHSVAEILRGRRPTEENSVKTTPAAVSMPSPQGSSTHQGSSRNPRNVLTASGIHFEFSGFGGTERADEPIGLRGDQAVDGDAVRCCTRRAPR